MIPRVHGPTFDPRRNTSAVQPVSPLALPEALQALREWRAHDPATVKWIEDGHPPLTQEEHYRRFGAPYTRHGARTPQPEPRATSPAPSPAPHTNTSSGTRPHGATRHAAPLSLFGDAPAGQ